MVRILGLVVAVILLVVWLVLMPKERPTVHADIVTSNFALYDAVRHLMPPEIDVQMLLPAGQDMHSFEPTPDDFKRLTHVQLFVYTSYGLPVTLLDFVAQNEVAQLRMDSEIEWRQFDKHRHQHAHGDTGHVSQASIDPHYWLDVNNQRNSLIYIATMLQEKFPAYAPYIQEQKLDYLAELESLEEHIRNAFVQCEIESFVVSHDAFNYFAHAYGMSTHAIQGLSPQAQPDPATMEAVIEMVESERIATLFFESFVSDTVAQTIAAQTGCKVDMLHTLANIDAPVSEGQAQPTYSSLMRENVAKIAQARRCQ
ncbi:MAG: hypothetical protein KU37_02285 [Sulfuricurvum sp. PC08-66]|nr:MAG: hypothetical protein KU37_02285 [Sulfuricurvum sp. PC08-66]